MRSNYLFLCCFYSILQYNLRRHAVAWEICLYISSTRTCIIEKVQAKPAVMVLFQCWNGSRRWQLISDVTLIYCFPVQRPVSSSSAGYCFLLAPIKFPPRQFHCKKDASLWVWLLSSEWKMELSTSFGVDVRHRSLLSVSLFLYLSLTIPLSLFCSYIYMTMLYMIHIPYDIYVTVPPSFFSLPPPLLLPPNQNAFSQPSLCCLGQKALLWDLC